jgi:transcriptional regulator GlxA family with amidase domain
MRIRVIIILFDGVQGLDVFGPAEVLAAADRLLAGAGYRLVFASTRGGPCKTSSGASVTTERLAEVRVYPGDTVLVAGGDDGPVAAAAADQKLLGWLRRAVGVALRFGSVCTGAFILGTLGLLDRKRCATHWSACDRLAATFPKASVERDAIYAIDGRLWTSAGITAGIDMTLAMVEEDHGSKIADAIAAQAVLYARRPGFQSQFSDALVAQVAVSDPLGPSISWGRRHLAELTVETLARHAGLAVRTLHRRTGAVLGVTPAKLIERLRVEHARTLLSSTELSQKLVAGQAGFSGNAQMQRAFKRHLGVDAGAVRLLFTAGSRRRRAAARVGAAPVQASARRAQA